MPTASKPPVADSYMQLIGEFPLRQIKSAADHARAKRLVLRLCGQDRDRGTREYLDVLVDLIAKYEQRTGQIVDRRDLSAAELVIHRIEQRGTSISALAREIGIPQSNLSGMLSGRRSWSKTAIRGLCRKLNIRAERFLE